MLKRARELLREKRASSSIETAVIFLVIMMIFSVVFEYVSLVSIGKEVQNAAQTTLDGMLMSNAMDIFSSIKNGRSSLEDWQGNVRFIDMETGRDISFSEKIQRQLGFGSPQNGRYYRGEDANDHVFFVADNDIHTDVMTEDNLTISAEVHVGRDIYFLGQKIVTAQIPIKVKSMYTRKNAVNDYREDIRQETLPNNLIGNNSDNAVKANGQDVQGNQNAMSGSRETPAVNNFDLNG